VIRTAVEGRQSLAVVEIVKIVPVLADEVAARLQFDAVLSGLGF
jgi:hypothetical protein